MPLGRGPVVRPGRKKYDGGGGTVSSFPFRYVKFYDDTPVTGRLLATVDLQGASVSSVGSTAVLNSSVSATVAENGAPKFCRFESDVGAVIGDQSIVQPNYVTSYNQQVVNDSTPDTTVVNPGNWIKGSTIGFDPGDITYQP